MPNNGEQIFTNEQHAAVLEPTPIQALSAENTRLLADNAKLRHLLNKSLALIARGQVEGAYNNIVAGPEYAERIFQAGHAALSRRGEA